MKRKSMSPSPIKAPEKKKSFNTSSDEKKKSPKSPAKSAKANNTKSVPGKSIGSTVRSARSTNTKNGSQLPEKKLNDLKKGGMKTPVVALCRINDASKKVQSSLGKKDPVRKDVRTAPVKVTEKSGQRVSSRSVTSPSRGMAKGTKTVPSKSKTSDIVGASKAPARSSPRTGSRVIDQTVADTPEAVVRRSSTRSVGSSPSVRSPRSQATDISIPDTPEEVSNKRQTKKTDLLKPGQTASRTGGRTPDVGSSGLRSSRLRGTPSNTTPTVGRKPTKRTATSSSTSASDSSPEKPASKASRSARGRVVSSTGSTSGSASSSKSTRSKPGMKSLLFLEKFIVHVYFIIDSHLLAEFFSCVYINCTVW